MQFLADVELVCEECKGTRYKSGILEIRYNGLNIHEVLQLTVREAMEFFHATPRLVHRLKVLDDVGLGYLRLGQSATTLSGGEAQRVKLAAHLAAASCQGTLFIFDEPTTGLHFDDIAKLLAAFQRLIENGGSLMVIEHNLDVIRAADWVIDLGPEGGAAGGEVVAAGTPGDGGARGPLPHRAVSARPAGEVESYWRKECGSCCSLLLAGSLAFAAARTRWPSSGRSSARWRAASPAPRGIRIHRRAKRCSSPAASPTTPRSADSKIHLGYSVQAFDPKACR